MLSALGTEVTIGGTKYPLRILTRHDWALIEQRILSLRGDPAAVAARLAASAPPEIARELYLKAYDDGVKARIVSADEHDAWQTTLEGLAYCFWLAVNPEEPEKRATVSEDDAMILLQRLTEESIRKVVGALVRDNPDLKESDAYQMATQLEEELGHPGIASLIAKVMGLPEGNASAPVEPGTPIPTPEREPLTGADGTPS